MNALLQLDGVAWWHVAGWTMLHYLWMGALVGVAALVSRVALRRASANVRYAAALTCLAVLAALPVGIGIGVGQRIGVRDEVSGVGGTAELTRTPAIETPTAPAGNQGAETAGGIVELKRESRPVEAGLANGPVSLETPSPDANPRPTTFSKQRVLTAEYGWQTVVDYCAVYLPWVWIVGAPLTFLLLTTGVVGAERLRRQSRVLRDGPVAEAAARIAGSLQIGRRVTIAVCERIAAPVLVGILRPMILLPPAALTGWSPDEIEMVLLHELAHVRRWDNLVNLVQRMVEAVLFFQPAVWLVSNWVRREREACCDAVVVGRTNRPHAYAELLVALASQLPRSVLFHPAASSAMAAGPLRCRIRRILGIEDDPLLISGKSLGVVMSGLLLAATLVVLSVTTSTQAEEESFTTEGTESTEGKTATDTLKAERINITTKDGQADLYAENGQLVLSTSMKARWPDESLFKNEAESQLSKRAFQVLRLKLVGATEDDLKYFGARRGLFIVELDRANRPMLLKQVNGAPIESFSDLQAALDGMKETPGTVVVNCLVTTEHGPQQVAFRRVNTLDGFGLQPWHEAAVVQWPTEETAESTTEGTKTAEQNKDATKEVAFVVGASRFAAGDSIKITKVRGSAAEFLLGHSYLVHGTYTLASRDRAELSALVTAKDSATGANPIRQVQTMMIFQRGSGEFTLSLPMTCEGWPHVSFYPAEGGQSFGGVYFGTGDSVLKEWRREESGETDRKFITVMDTEGTQGTEGIRAALGANLPVEVSEEDERRIVAEMRKHPAVRKASIKRAPNGIQTLVTIVITPPGKKAFTAWNTDSQGRLTCSVEFVARPRLHEKAQDHGRNRGDLTPDVTAGIEDAQAVPADVQVLKREIAELQRSKRELQGKLKELLSEVLTSEKRLQANGAPSDYDEALAKLRSEHEIRAQVLQHQLADTVKSLKMKEIALQAEGAISKGPADPSIVQWPTAEVHPTPMPDAAAMAESLRSGFAVAIPSAVSDEDVARAVKELSARDEILAASVSLLPDGQRGLSLQYKRQPPGTSPVVDWVKGPDGRVHCRFSFSTPADPGLSPPAMISHAQKSEKFPTLEEQKLADLIWKRMQIEIEPLSEADMKRVAAMGYSGGVIVKYGRGGGGMGGAGQYGEIKFGDILVGLHVWPTPDLQSVVNVLDRDNLSEFNPLKFYVVRRMEEFTGFGNDSHQIQDELVTGRISVEVPAKKQTTTSALSGTPVLPLNTVNPAAKPPLEPGMKEVREERVDPETGKTQTIITVIPESQPSSPAPRPTLPPTRPKPLPTHEPIPIPPLSDAEKAKLLKGGPFTLEFYYSPDSQPCRDAEKMIAEYQAAFPGLIEVERIDVVADPARAARMSLRHVPMLRLTRNQSFVDEKTGVWTLPQLTTIVTEYARRSSAPTANQVQPQILQAAIEDAKRRGPLKIEFYYQRDSEPSEQVARMLFDFKETYGSGLIDLQRIDVDESPSVAKERNVGDVPALVSVLKDNRTFLRNVPELTAEQLADFVVSELRTMSLSDARQKLLYDGKSFNEWRSAWKTELSMENRLEAVKALAAFGANGQGKEATEAILEVAEQLDWTYIDNSSVGNLKQACVDAFTTGQTTGGYRIPGRDWLPLVKPLIAEQGKPGAKSNLATYMQPPRGDKNLVPELIELAKVSATKNWATWGLKSVDPTLEDERVVTFFREQLQVEDLPAKELALATRTFLYSDNSDTSTGQPATKLRFFPELESLLFHQDGEVRKAARWDLCHIRPEDTTQLLKQLTVILDDPERKSDRVEAVRALAAMGPQAKVAEQVLLKIAQSDDDPARYAAALAVGCIWEGVPEHSMTTRGRDDYVRLFGEDYLKQGKFDEFEQPWSDEQRELFPSDARQTLGGGGGFF